MQECCIANDIPVDVIEEILSSLLPSEKDELRSAVLVLRKWRNPAQRRLFAEVSGTVLYKMAESTESLEHFFG